MAQSSIVIERSHLAVCSDLGVDVATFAFVQVDLVLDLVDVFSLLAKHLLVFFALAL